MATLYRWRYGGTLMVTLKAVQKRSSQVDSKGLQSAADGQYSADGDKYKLST